MSQNLSYAAVMIGALSVKVFASMIKSSHNKIKKTKFLEQKILVG